MAYSVYKHTSPNGKVYIGITSRKPEQRWSNGYGYVKNKHFTHAINKYGWENIKHEILFSNLTKESTLTGINTVRSLISYLILSF